MQSYCTTYTNEKLQFLVIYSSMFLTQTMHGCNLHKAQNTEIESMQHLSILVDKQCCLGHLGSAGVSDLVLYRPLLKISVNYLIPSAV